MKVWTEAYSPFIMGGDCNAPISTEVEVGEPFDIGAGIQAYLVVSPTGKTFVAESETGAFVGTDIEKVKADVAAADPAVMKKQIEDAKDRVKKATALSKEDFWGRFR